MPATEPERICNTDTREADAVQQFFQRPLFLSLTVGIPFCIFKLLFGLTAVRTGTGGSPILAGFGWLIICWASADLLMNIGREVFDLFGRPAPFEYCTIAQMGRLFHKPTAFLAIDTLIAFVIICTMLWSGWIATLSRMEMYLWYAATTMNLISLSLVVLYNELGASR
jgi:hypothetical protein